MYKLLIVEDEKWEREGLIGFVDWSGLGIDIVGAAANGMKGLQLAREYRPDIIITDIKMPIMDGMEFTRSVRQFLPDCRIVIITGYDDFEYAKEAIQLGVYDYLLKPVQKDQLLDVINKTLKSISDEINTAEYMRALKHRISESAFEDRERFLLALAEGRFDSQKYAHAAFSWNMFFNEHGIAAAVLRFDTAGFLRDMRYDERQPYLRELYLFIREIVGEDGIVAQDTAGNGEIIMCLPSGMGIGNQIAGIIEQFRQAYDRRDIPEAAVGVGSAVKTLQVFSESYLQAKTALDHIFFMKDEEILLYDDIACKEDSNEPEAYDFFACAVGYTKKILNGVVSLDSRELSALSKELFEFIGRRSVNRNLLCNYFAGLISELSSLLIRYDCSLTHKLIDRDILETLNDFIRLEDMKKWFEELLLHANYCISEKMNNKEEHIVEKVMDIISGEYESSIGIETIAHRLELSPNYLGSLFKQHTGKRFTEALTDVRMKKAEELLASGTENVLDTARAVGYGNAAYFCTVFKKKHGISPMDYQRSVSDKECL